MKSLYEQYRPKSFDEVVGQEKAITKVRLLLKRGVGGRAFWISGKSGTGKTTLAYLLSQEMTDVEMCITELDATRMTPARLADTERDMWYLGMGEKGGKAYIINEAHGLCASAIKQLLVMLERLPSHVVVIFTTTTEGNDTLFEMDDYSPLLSRCIEIQLAQRDLAKPFARRAQAIAQTEGLDGQPLTEYIKLINRCKGNMRMALQKIEAGEMMI